MSTEELSLTGAPQASLDRAHLDHVDRILACPEEHRMLLVQDRARIAQDLHDHVIQRLFGTGLALQNLASRVEDADLRDHIEHAVVGIDEAIGQIRAAVFALSPEPHTRRDSARHIILAIVNETPTGLGPTPTVTFSGPVDLAVTSRLLDDVSAVVRECLTNVVRHSHASTIAVSVRVDDDAVSVVVYDDGAGIPRTGRRSGLRNMQARAERRGGELVVESHPGHTSVAWIVPTPAPTTRGLPRS